MVLFNDKEYLKLEAMIKGQAAQKDQDAIEDLSFFTNFTDNYSI